MATDLEFLKQLEEELGLGLPQQDFRIITQGSSGYALDNQQHVIGLNLHNLQLRNIPIVISQFIHLIGLSLYHNQLSVFPEEILKLSQLQKLSLSRNYFTDLPDDLTRLKNLRYLDLTDNRLKVLPEAITTLGLEIYWEGEFFQSEGIILEDNPLENPPVEIVKQGRLAVVNYFRSLQQEQKILNEAKVLLVGEGGAGKTSLVKRFFGEEFDPNESQTHGINIKPWKLGDGEQNITVRFWDFGGQEIMHATHQFFLSKRSFYVLVLDSRREENIEYWLKHIESFGGNSPIIIVMNKIDQHPGFDVNRSFLQKKYPEIREFYRISCASGEGMVNLVEGLSQALADVELLRTPLPATWFEVKAQLEMMTSSFIRYEDYEAICRQAQIFEKSEQHTLIELLNDLGVIVYFQEFGLHDTHILEPAWLTEAVYKIINSKQLADSKGVLALDEIDGILELSSESSHTYPRSTYRFIIDLMKKFELCYVVNEHHILVPDLLEVQEPYFDFDYENSLQFLVTYDFLPRAVMPRFIVKMHEDIKESLRWRTGIVLEDTTLHAIAVIKADYEAKKLTIYVNGEHQRSYLNVISKSLRDINQSFTRLKYAERVCLPDNPSITVSYSHLLRLEEMGQDMYIPEGADQAYRVKDLLGVVYIESNQEQLTHIVRNFIQEFQSSLHQFYKKYRNSAGIQNELEGFFEGVSTLLANIAQKLQEIDCDAFKHIELNLKSEFPSLSKLFDNSCYTKYASFLLTAEYFYQNLLQGLPIEAASIIIGYAGVVDAILIDCVGKPIIASHEKGWKGFRLTPERASLPTGLGVWKYLTKPLCPEYQQWIENYYSQDEELCHFLLYDVGKEIEKIRSLRNKAAHGLTPLGAKDADYVRKRILFSQDKRHNTLMEWCLRILFYQPLKENF